MMTCIATKPDKTNQLYFLVLNHDIIINC